MSQAVADAPDGAPLRVFTLEIGETVSSAMCEGIARAGNGLCLMAATSESIIAKAAKLVRASRACFLVNAYIDWGTRFAPSSDVTSKSAFLAKPLNTFHRYIPATGLLFSLC